MPYVRTVKTSSGATAVQIVYSSRRGSRQIEHLGSAHTPAEVELLKAAAWQKLAAGQGVLDLGLDAGARGGPLPITSSRMGCLPDALAHAYDVLGFGYAAGGECDTRSHVYEWATSVEVRDGGGGVVSGQCPVACPRPDVRRW